MTEALAVLMATLMIPAAPLNSAMSETYLGYGEPTAYVQQAEEEQGTVFTPNGSEVPVTYSEESITDDNINSRIFYYYFTGGGDDGHYYDGYYYNLWDEEVTVKNKNISRKYEPTSTYNSKAFAFYLYWEGVYSVRPCSMSSYDKYIEDNSYVFVDEPQVNDIVLYFSGDNNKFITAGVVTDVNASEASDPANNEPFVKQLSKLRVQSMWSLFGVFEHRGDLCPFVGKYTSKYITNSPTAEVQYLRRHETHNFKAVYGSSNGKTHTEKCSCGETQIAEHKYTYPKKTAAGHTATCECGVSNIEIHSWIPYHNSMFPQPGTYVECRFCHFVKKLGDHEIIPIMPYKKQWDELFELKLSMN